VCGSAATSTITQSGDFYEIVVTSARSFECPRAIEDYLHTFFIAAPKQALISIIEQRARQQGPRGRAAAQERPRSQFKVAIFTESYVCAVSLSLSSPRANEDYLHTFFIAAREWGPRIDQGANTKLFSRNCRFIPIFRALTRMKTTSGPPPESSFRAFDSIVAVTCAPRQGPRRCTAVQEDKGTFFA